MQFTLKRLAFVLAVIVALASVAYTLPLVQITAVDSGHKVHVVPTPTGLSVLTVWSESTSPSPGEDTIGKLYDVGGGWYEGKICDHTSNGVDDRQVYYNTQFERLANETYDTNGAAEGCGKELFDRDKAYHQVNPNLGGTVSCHPQYVGMCN